MRHLILMRHAKAVRANEAPSDRARGLTERGRREAREAGVAIAALATSALRAVISPSARTRETWEALAPTLPGHTRVTIVETLYNGAAATLWAEARRAAAPGQDSSVLVIAHNPGVTDLVARLLSDAGDRAPAARRLAEHVPTSGFAAFELSGDTLEAAGARLIGWGRLRDDA